MKIRLGLVSNSSSSSFCIMGYTYDFSELPEEVVKSIEEADYDAHSIKKLDSVSDDVWKNVQLLISADSERIWIGAPIETMKEDETLAEFRSRAKDVSIFILQKLGVKDVQQMKDAYLDYGEFTY